MPNSVGHEDTNALLAQIQQNILDVVELNKRIREFLEEFQNKFYLNAQDHQRHLNLRLKLFEQLQLLVGVKYSSDSVAQCSISNDKEVRDGNRGCYSERDDQLQLQEAAEKNPAKGPDYYLTELGKLMSQHYEQMKGLAEAHEQLLCQERNLLLQLQTTDEEKNSSLTQLQRKLDELENVHGQQLQQAHENVQQIRTQFAEKEYQLDEAEKKLAESNAKNNELSAKLTSCKQWVQSDSVGKKNRLAQLQLQLDEANKKLAESDAKNSELSEKLKNCKTKLRTSREMASMTKLRQIKELDMTETFSAMVSRLEEVHKSAIAENIKEQDNVTSSRDSKDDNETDHLQRLRENHQQLTELLEARKVASFMFQHDALTIRELQSIQQYSTPFEAADALLKIIWELGKEVQVYEYFMKALQKTNQQHIWSWLSYTDFDINCEHVGLIQNHYSNLVKTIEHCGLIALLFSRGVIDVQDKDYLEAELSCVRRNEKLLSMIMRKSEQHFDLFLNCLSETGQLHVVEKLRGNLDSPCNTVKTNTDNSSGEHPLASIQVPYSSQMTDRLSTCASFEIAEHQSNSSQVHEAAQLTAVATPMWITLHDCWYKTLASCFSNKYLFINDRYTVFRVDLSTNKVISWPVDGGPCGLSVNTTEESAELASSQVQRHQRTTDELTAETCLSHVISSGGRGPVAGVTVCNGRLFVLREDSKEKIEQYEIVSFNKLTAIRIEGLSDDDCWYKTLASCFSNKYLFINDRYTVFRVDLSTNKVISWPVDGGPCGLSVNTTGNVLVTCFRNNKIIEYSTSGSLVRSIKLQMNHVTRPVHTVELTDGLYVVSHYGPVKGVSLIDQHGSLVTSYRKSKTTRVMDNPRWIVLVSDCILVADAVSNNVLLLDIQLNVARELSVPVESRLNGPSRMYLDQSSGILFIGEGWGNHRVLVFDYMNMAFGIFN